MPFDPTSRFSDRVSAYRRFRPGYPAALFDHLQRQCGLDERTVIADIGSGTGILTRCWLERGYRVFAVEPNGPMRAVAEELLGDRDRFVSRAGRAERTSLDSASIDLLTAAQAFHWFDRDATRREFRRVLRADGWVAIIWNDRRKTSTPFLEAYERLLLEHGTDYVEVDHTRIEAPELAEFFGPRGYHRARFDNHQQLDLPGLEGRLESSSYAPPAGSAAYEPMIRDLRQIFAAYSSAGTVTLEYDTVVYYGHLS